MHSHTNAVGQTRFWTLIVFEKIIRRPINLGKKSYGFPSRKYFNPWVRWERPGSGFESSSGGVWKFWIFQEYDMLQTPFCEGFKKKHGILTHLGFFCIHFVCAGF